MNDDDAAVEGVQVEQTIKNKQKLIIPTLAVWYIRFIASSPGLAAFATRLFV